MSSTRAPDLVVRKQDEEAYWSGPPLNDRVRDERFLRDLSLDSLDLVEITMECEDEFEITIPDDDYDKLKTIGDLIRYLSLRRDGL